MVNGRCKVVNPSHNSKTYLEDIAGLGGYSGGGGLAAMMTISPQIVHKCHHEYSYRDGHTNNYDGQDTADNHRRQCQCYIVVCLL